MRIFFSFFFVSIIAISSLGCTKKETRNSIKGFKFTIPAITEGNSEHTADITIIPDGVLVSPFDAGYEIVEGTARFGKDIKPASGSLTFKPGQSGQIIPLTIIGDTFPELTEDFELRITYEGKTISQVINIPDDDELESIMTDADGFYTSLDHPSMELVWSDEFGDTTLNTDNWSYELGDGCDKGICGWGNNELESYTDHEENVRVENGKLVLTALKKSDYTSGRIKTEDKVEITYGRVDIRAKLPKGKGIWPAIWMLGINIGEVGWPACGEVDIMELIGSEPGITHGTVHYNDNGYKSSTGSRTLSSGNFSDKFHVFSIVWNRDQIEWYMDNEKFKTFGNSNINSYPFNAAFYFIMNVAVGGNWPGNPDETTVFPQSMTVDYIRVYQ